MAVMQWQQFEYYFVANISPSTVCILKMYLVNWPKVVEKLRRKTKFSNTITSKLVLFLPDVVIGKLSTILQ